MRLFNENKCFKCHCVSIVGIKAENETGKMAGGDFVNLAETYESDFLNKFIRKEAELDCKTHKKGFKGTD
jgi:hypothetical protein